MAYQGEALTDSKYDVLDPILESIHTQCVMIENNSKKICVRRFTQVLETFIDDMKNIDPTFKKIFNKIEYTGSFYDGVRVGEATEFDLNLILKLNINMEMNKRECRPGFINIRVSNSNLEKPIRDWIVNGSLNPTKVKQWLEGVVARTIKANSSKIQDCQVRTSKSGPAITLKIIRENEISIDLVPVIQFSSNQWPPIPRKPNKLLNGSHEEPWFAVPKDVDAWRMSFPIHERHIIKQLHNFKYILRLLKKVRDDFQMYGIASYYIKTLFLWELDVKRDPSKWSKYKGRIFMHMIIRLKEVLDKKELPFYWDVRSNLLGQLKHDTISNFSGKIKNFILQIDKHINAQDKKALENYIKKMLGNTDNSTRQRSIANEHHRIANEHHQSQQDTTQSSCAIM